MSGHSAFPASLHCGQDAAQTVAQRQTLVRGPLDSAVCLRFPSSRPPDGGAPRAARGPGSEQHAHAACRTCRSTRPLQSPRPAAAPPRALPVLPDWSVRIRGRHRRAAAGARRSPHPSFTSRRACPRRHPAPCRRPCAAPLRQHLTPRQYITPRQHPKKMHRTPRKQGPGSAPPHAPVSPLIPPEFPLCLFHSSNP
jgi:hypothetical protein